MSVPTYGNTGVELARAEAQVANIGAPGDVRARRVDQAAIQARRQASAFDAGEVVFDPIARGAGGAYYPSGASKFTLHDLTFTDAGIYKMATDELARLRGQ